MTAVKAVKFVQEEQLTGDSTPRGELSLRFLYYMQMMREVEDRIERKLYRQGKILGGVYVGRGQEAIPVGSGLVAEKDDVLCPSHRDLALFLIRGIHPRQVFAQYMGRVGGLTRGKDGNMHMGDMKRNLVAIVSSIAASVPVASGVAFALKYKGTKNVAFDYFGDGATSRGDWHEGVNMAAVQSLPLVLICNNNQYAYSTPLSKQMLCKNVADRAAAYGIPAEIVDGNDVFAVYEATQRAVAHARAGLGPYMLECKTFRMTGHAAHDAAEYVPKHLWAEWAKKDPILRVEKLILDKGWADQQAIDKVHADVRSEVDEAIEWAEKSPYPDPSELCDNVYDRPC